MKKVVFFLLFCFTLLAFHSCAPCNCSSMNLKEAELRIAKGEAVGQDPIKVNTKDGEIQAFKTITYDKKIYSLEVSGDEYVYEQVQPVQEDK